MEEYPVNNENLDENEGETENTVLPENYGVRYFANKSNPNAITGYRYRTRNKTIINTYY